MKKKKKSSKGLGLTRKTKILSTIIITTIVMLLMTASYGLGGLRGSVQGAYGMVGIEGICDKTGGTMQEEYCVLNNEGTYKHHIECNWGKFVVYDEEPIKWYTNIDPRSIIMQCKIKD